jgi:hypothetical protein
VSNFQAQWVYFSDERLMNAIHRGLAESGELVVNRMAMFMPRVTGNLLKSRFYNMRNGRAVGFDVGASSKYAIFVHEGTGIFARNGQGRKTPWTYFNKRAGRYVRTQGQQPKPFAEEALEATIDEMPGRIISRVNAES